MSINWCLHQWQLLRYDIIHNGRSIESNHNQEILTLKWRDLFVLQRYSRRLKKTDFTYQFLMPKHKSKNHTMIISQLKTTVQNLLLGSKNYAHQLPISKKAPNKTPIHSGKKLTELIKYLILFLWQLVNNYFCLSPLWWTC